MSAVSRRTSATAIGFVAVLLWSALALLTVVSGRVPPFELASLTFAIGAALGGSIFLARRGAIKRLRQPPEVWTLGVAGLFGYHALYFMALRLAHPAPAGLINYLWPLLIVLFSALLPHEHLRAHHIVGAVLGLAGTVVLLAGGDSLELTPDDAPGLAAAFVAAFVWATYSVLSRLFSAVPTDVVVGFCAATAVLAGICHLLFEETVWPTTQLQWFAVVALGLGPVGGAFYAWDFGVKNGDIRVLGAMSYAAPVLSTALLVAAGFAHASVPLAIAAALIAGGGLIAAKDMVKGSRAATSPSARARSPQS